MVWLQDLTVGEVPNSHYLVGFAVFVGGLVPSGGVAALAELSVQGSPPQTVSQPFTIQPPSSDHPEEYTLVPTDNLNLDGYTGNVAVACKLVSVDGPFTIDPERNCLSIEAGSLKTN